MILRRDINVRLALQRTRGSQGNISERTIPFETITWQFQVTKGNILTKDNLVRIQQVRIRHLTTLFPLISEYRNIYGELIVTDGRRTVSSTEVSE